MWDYLVQDRMLELCVVDAIILCPPAQSPHARQNLMVVFCRIGTTRQVALEVLEVHFTEAMAIDLYCAGQRMRATRIREYDSPELIGSLAGMGPFSFDQDLLGISTSDGADRQKGCDR
jgi:hypothetical protein